MSESMRLAGRALQEKMQRRPYGLYNAAITELGLLLLVATVISSWPDFSKQLNPELFVFLVAAAFLASLAPVPTASGVQLTVALAPLLAAVLSLPAGMATLAGVIGTIDKRIPGRSIAWHRWFYNRGQYALIYGFAAIVYRGLVGLQPDSSGNLLSPGAVSAAVIAIVTVIALNSFLLVTSVAVATHEPIVRVAYRTLEGSILTYAGLAPMGVVMAVLLYVVNPAPNNFYVATLIFILLLVYRELTRQALQVKRVAQGSYVAQSRLIDKKDGSTFGHSERVGLLAEAVAGKMGLQLHLVEQIRIGATLHDLGKIAIPDHILHKTGTLDEEDIAVLRTHPDEGFEVLKEQGVLSEAAKIVRSHHENYDGSGYPLGLTGREIPVGARIARVVDSYDTMTNERIYRRSVKDAFEALSELHSLAGSTYDPEIVEAVTAVIAERHPEVAAQLLGLDPEQARHLVEPLKRRQFAVLWLGLAFSNLGEALATVGLALAAYAFSHEIWRVAAILGAITLPKLLFGLTAEQLAGRFNRKGLMVVTSLVRAGLVATVPLLVGHQFAGLLLLTFLVSLASVAFSPARAAVIPDVLPPEMLRSGSTILGISERIIQVLAMVLAAAFLFERGLNLVFSVDAVIFVMSGLALLTIQLPRLAPETDGAAQPLRRSLNGLRQALDVGELRLVFPLTVLIAASVASLVPLSLALSEALKQGAVGFVLLQASFGVGALVGGLLTSLLKTSRRGILIFIAGLGLGASIMLAGASSVIWITMIFFAGAGLCNLVFLIPIVELIRDVTDAQNRARVYAARFTIIQLGVLLGVIYAAIIVTQVPSASPQLALFFTGAVIALVSAIFGAAPTMRRI